MKCVVETGSVRLSSEGISSRLPGSLLGCVGTGDLSAHSSASPGPPQQAQCRLTASGCLGRLEQALSAGPDQELTFPGFPQP